MNEAARWSLTRSAVALAPLVLFLLLMPASRVDACSCGQIGPACQSFWKTEAVFDATVEAIETTTRETAYEGISRPVLDREHVVKLSVRQAWKGVQAGPLEVVTNAQSSACGYEFKVGKRYLVFAWKRPYDGRWSVSTCSLTQEYNGTGSRRISGFTERATAWWSRLRVRHDQPPGLRARSGFTEPAGGNAGPPRRRRHRSVDDFGRRRVRVP